jgi:peptide/nickel transport system ATP-binding protein
LSGGQKQRVNLARALAAEPDLILCDEVTSALDTVVATAILDLLKELQRELGISFMFISHDITTLRGVCDQVIVLYAGQKVEEGSRKNFAAPPFHPYTNLLINSVPELEQGWLDRKKYIRQTIPANADGQQLCGFLDRCSVRIEGKCDKQSPPWVALSQGSEVSCHLSGEELKRLQQHSSQTPTLKPSSSNAEGG